MDTNLSSFSVYRHLADALAPYVAEMGYTHIEMPPAEWVDDTGVGRLREFLPQLAVLAHLMNSSISLIVAIEPILI